LKRKIDMTRQLLTILWLNMAALVLIVPAGYAKGSHPDKTAIDSAATRAEVLKIVNTVIKASGTFDIDAVANLYTPNALIADEEPPFSWNGSTAGVQWVSTVEKTCKEFKLRDFKGKIGRISVYLQTEESVYLVVPVNYTAQIKGDPFEEDGAFTFVLRMVNGSWLIKSQVWVARRAM
jgi:hypothetical protein